MIYLDYAATTPMSDEAIEMYGKVAEAYTGNASSIHDYGSSAEKVIDTSREHIAGYLNAIPRGLFFTGSGSEANNLALRSLALANREKGSHIITTAAEHSSVRYTMKVLQKEGFEITEVPLDDEGRVDPDELKQCIRPDTILASIHHGNSEIGTVQPAQTIGKLLKEHEVLYHSDCVQTFGKIAVDVEAFQMDAISISAHKIYGPKGVGAAYIDPSARWRPTLPGTTQERGFRPGTVNTAGVASFMKAAEQVMEGREGEAERERELRRHLIEELRSMPYDITIEGPEKGGLPNILGMRIHGMEGQYAMLECNRKGLAISTGSACSVGTEKASASMRALGRDTQEGREFIRLSLGRHTTDEDIERAVEILTGVLTAHFEMVKL